MTITYVVGNGLYVNVTNKCTNSCDFCVRSVADGTYGSLWLKREPTKQEILDAILKNDLSLYSELVFCGYGEPTIRIFDIIWVVEQLKEISSIYIMTDKNKNVSPLKIRINTNGHLLLIHGKEILPKFCKTFDEISVSLNAPNSKRYVEICHPHYGEQTFDYILTFVKMAKQYTNNIVFSVVKGALTETEIAQCLQISNLCGVQLKVREYISK